MSEQTRRQFATWWKQLGGEWLPQSMASHFAGVSTAAVAKAIKSQRLATKERKLNGRTVRVVRVADLMAIGSK